MNPIYQVLDKNNKTKYVELMIVDRDYKEKDLQYYATKEMQLKQNEGEVNAIWTAKVYFPFDDPKEFDNVVDKYKPWFVEEMKKRGVEVI